MKQYKRSLYIFRRDLRITDNTALIEAQHKSNELITCFIFDPRQVDAINQYRSLNAIQFMIESLIDLEKQITNQNGKLYIFLGEAEEVVNQLLEKFKCDAIFANVDYTPFSIQRDKTIGEIAQLHSVTMELYHDIMLHSPDEIKKIDEGFYSVFTPYWKNGVKLNNVQLPKKYLPINFFVPSIKEIALEEVYKKLIPIPNNQLHIHGGRTNALKILKNLESFKSYAIDRDVPSKGTTNLSAHLKFGTISIREAHQEFFDQLGSDSPLIRQLYWHDFYTQIAYHAPYVYGSAFHTKYNIINWNNNKKDFDRWCQGNTGFPIVDAGMRQLNITGFMHNRLRMIVASFLTKDLHIDWQWGEKYFAQLLIDYDPAVNNGNWQWTASTGCDPQPYFRIFNPWLQQKKFDPKCLYIKKWVPELRNTAIEVIHNWFKPSQKEIFNYPRPMLEHGPEANQAKKLYKEVA